MKKITLLLFFMIAVTNGYSQLSEDFEGTWPPTGWTIETTNPNFTWQEEAGFPINGNASATVLYDPDLVPQDESLISPLFTVPTGSALSFVFQMSYFWAVDPNENYDFIVSISTDSGATWTPLWDESALGVFMSFDNIAVSIPLTAYEGQTNVKVKFQYVGVDGAALVLDDVLVALPPPNLFAPYCGFIEFANDVEPITLVNFAGINSPSSNLAGPENGTTIVAHEDFRTITGNVTAGNSYTITLKGNTAGIFENRFIVFADWNQDGDFADPNENYPITQTITNSNGLDAIQATQLLEVPPSALAGVARMRVKKIFGTDDYLNPCLGSGYGQFEEYALNVTAASTDAPDYANLQFPETATINPGGSVIVYGQVYEAGLTDVAPNIVGQAPGITAWVGISATDTNPNTWTTWIPATWNSGHVSNNDEYQATIGADLAPGTYYYATRFRLNTGIFVYGGTNFGFWNGTDKISGVLTVNPLANDTCATATTATLPYDSTMDATFATNTGGFVTVCTPGMNDGVWYTFTGDGGNVTIDVTNVTGGWDPEVGVYTGACGALVCEGSVDATFEDEGESITIATTAGTVYLVNVGEYSSGTDNPEGSFRIQITSDLSSSEFDITNLKVYPNPIKNVLNVSFSQEISTVEVYNMIGQKVKSVQVNATEGQLDMSSLSSGAYVVKVYANEQVKTIKMIKE
jgi:hypothetical protein